MALSDKQLQEDMDFILDTFSGADGGATFFAFKSLINALDKKNDEDSKKVLLVVTRFARLIRASKSLLKL